MEGTAMAVSDELIGFVREALARGLSRPQIEEALRQAGWKPEQVSGALAAFAAVDFPRPRPSLSAQEAFKYLLLFTTLYIVAVNLGSLLRLRTNSVPRGGRCSSQRSRYSRRGGPTPRLR
jgi:hypothetical protein